MPAYGKNLMPAEVNALVAFMETLRPAGSRPRAPPSTPCRRAAERGAAARDTPVSHPIAAVAPAVGLASWSFEPAVTIPALTAAALYWRGFTVLSLRMPERFDAWRPVAFLAGLATLVLALCSPSTPSATSCSRRT